MNRLMIISLNSDPILQYGTEHNGGQSKYVLELGKNLVKEGWDIDVFTIKNSNTEDVVSITEGFTVYRFPLPNSQDYSYSIKESDVNWVADSITHFINENKRDYSLVLCCYWLSGLIGLQLKDVLRKNILITFCSFGYFKEPGTSTSFRIEKERYIAQNIDHIIATSEEEKRMLVNFYEALPDKITVIPRGVDTEKFKKINEI